MAAAAAVPVVPAVPTQLQHTRVPGKYACHCYPRPAPDPPCCSYETYQLLARIITFGERIAELLTTVQSRLAEASHPKTRSKLSALLQHAARGVLANPTGVCGARWGASLACGAAGKFLALLLRFVNGAWLLCRCLPLPAEVAARHASMPFQP